MTIAYVGATASGGPATNSSTTSLDMAISVSSGELLIAEYRWEGGGINDTVSAGISDTAGNIWVGASSQVTGGSSEDQKVTKWYTTANSTGNITITFTSSSARPFRHGLCLRYSHDGTIAFQSEIKAGNGNNVQPADAGDISVQSGDLVTLVVGHYNSIGSPMAAISGWNKRTETTLNNSFDSFPSSTNAAYPCEATFNSADSFAAIAWVFRETPQTLNAHDLISKSISITMG